MSAHNITDAFDDCINRIATGQSIEQCLRAYPQFADRLRPLLETSKVVQRLRITQSELLQDQDIVWQKMLQQSLSPKIMPIRRRRPPYQLLIAAVMLVLTMAVTVFMLSRPDLPPEEDDAIIATLTLETLVPDSSATSTATLTLTVTSTQTKTPTETPRVTLTVSPSPTATLTMTSNNSVTPTVVPSATQVSVPSATFVPGCGAPLTEEDAIARVLSIYPNTTITSIQQTLKYGEILVWEVRTSHNILIDIDVACGTILVIEQSGSNNGTSNENTNTNESNGGGSSGSGSNSNGATNDNSSSGGSDDNTNTNDNDDNDDDDNDDDDNDDDDNSNDNNSDSGSSNDDD
ncbi:MAG: hypothetical protein CL607_16660 [Anaerolineaceae bacterium]|nr:hypothetical protein [Anaerolineaceae bacterium]